MATFFSYKALVSQRSSGYKNTAYALAELIDNSFDANANEVHVILVERKVGGRRQVEEIVIYDDGQGMSPELLQSSLQFGHTTNNNLEEVVSSKKKGKFGYGLPNASLSQCKNIHVYSWTQSDDCHHVYLDLDELESTNSIEIPQVEKNNLPDYISSFFDSKNHSGTVVVWKNCDRLSHARGDSIITNSSELLGRLYRYLIEANKKIKFSVFEFNEQNRKYLKQVTEIIRPNDPLFLMKNTIVAKALYSEVTPSTPNEKSAEVYRKYVTSETECLPTSELLIDYTFPYTFHWRGENFIFEIKTSVANVDMQKPGIRDGGGTEVGKYYGKKESTGNITFVRADREIAAGAFGGFYNRTVLPNRYWGIEVKFDANADDLIGVHNNKQGIEFTKTTKQNDSDEFDPLADNLVQARTKLWLELSDRISSAVKAAQKKIKQQAVEWDATHITHGGETTNTPTIPVSTPDTAKTINGVEGKRPEKLPAPEIVSLENRLIQKYPSIEPEDIKDAIKQLDASLTRACVLYAPSESKQLWSYTKVYDFVVVLINTNHEFYKKVLFEFRVKGLDGALTALELFISSLAIEEESFVGNPTDKEAIENFRESVGSKLNRYISKLPDEVVARYNKTSRAEDLE